MKISKMQYKYQVAPTFHTFKKKTFNIHNNANSIYPKVPLLNKIKLMLLIEKHSHILISI